MWRHWKIYRKLISDKQNEKGVAVSSEREVEYGLMFGVAHRSGPAPASPASRNNLQPLGKQLGAYSSPNILCLTEISHLTAQCPARSRDRTKEPFNCVWKDRSGGLSGGAATTSSCRIHERVLTAWKSSCFRDMLKNTATRKVAWFAVNSEMLRRSHA